MTTCRFFIAPCRGYAYVPVTQWGDSDRFTWGIQVLSAEDFPRSTHFLYKITKSVLRFFTRIV